MIVQPGNTRGLLTIDGDLDAVGATFSFEIAGRDAGVSQDQVFVAGLAHLDGATFNIQFVDGFLPDIDETFRLFRAEGGLSGLETALFPVLADSGTVSGFFDPAGGGFVVSGVVPAPDALPAALWLCAPAVAALALAGRPPRGRCAARSRYSANVRPAAASAVSVLR